MPDVPEDGEEQVHGVQGGLLLLEGVPEEALEAAQVRVQGHETSLQG